MNHVYIDSLQKTQSKVNKLEEDLPLQESKIDGLVLNFKELEKKTDYAMVIHR